MNGMKVASLIGAPVLVGLAALLLWSEPSVGPQWTVGQRYQYRFDVDVSRTTASPTELLESPEGKGSLSLRLVAKGQYSLRVIEADDAGVLATVQLDPTAMLSLQMLGQDAAAGPVGASPRMGVHISTEGQVDRTFFPQDFPAGQRALLQVLFTEAGLRRAAGPDRWQIDERDLHGALSADYAQVTPNTVEKRKIRYESLPEVLEDRFTRATQQLDHLATFQLDADGALASARVSERFELRDGERPLVAGSKRIELDLVFVDAIGSDDQPAPELFVEGGGSAPEAPFRAANLERQMLVQQAAGMSLERIQRTIQYVHVLGPTADHKERFWRGVGYLKLHPEAVTELKPSFLRAHAAGRAMTLDLLAAAGHPGAQSVLRELLASPEARSEPHYDELLDRLSFVYEPTPQTVAFARAQRAASSGKARRALTFALGALAGHAGRSGNLELARQVNGELVAELEAATTIEAKQELLGALGNAGIKENTAVIARHAGDASGLVRYAAAYALRHVPTDESAQVLLRIASDNGIHPQHAALSALRVNTKLEPHRLDRVISLVHEGVIRPQNYDDVVSILANNHDDRLPQIAAFMLTKVSGANAPQLGRLRELAKGS